MTPPICASTPVWSLGLTFVIWYSSFSVVRADDLSTQLENAPPILRVEEDWEIAIADPDPAGDLPQIVTVFGPTNALFDTHTVFEVNHATQPSYSEGGMQLQVWWGDLLVGADTQCSPSELNTNGEIIRYTTVTRLLDNRLKMSIINGTSTTWGNFGGTGTLSVSLITGRDDLNPYDPENSLRHSRVTFGANRVNHFCRREIRFFSENGLFAKETAVKYVHRLAVETASP